MEILQEDTPKKYIKVRILCQKCNKNRNTKIPFHDYEGLKICNKCMRQINKIKKKEHEKQIKEERKKIKQTKLKYPSIYVVFDELTGHNLFSSRMTNNVTVNIKRKIKNESTLLEFLKEYQEKFNITFN